MAVGHGINVYPQNILSKLVKVSMAKQWAVWFHSTDFYVKNYSLQLKHVCLALSKQLDQLEVCSMNNPQPETFSSEIVSKDYW